MLAGHAAADHDDLRLGGTGHPAHQHSGAALGPEEVVGTDLRGQASGDLAHRAEQRERTVRELDRLVRDGGGAGREQRIGARRGRREVQVGEEGHVRSHQRVLGLDRLLDLDQQLGRTPHLLDRVDDARTGKAVRVVVEAGALPGAGLHQHVVAAADQLVGAGGRERDPVLVVLDLRGDADVHKVTVITVPCTGPGSIPE